MPYTFAGWTFAKPASSGIRLDMTLMAQPDEEGPGWTLTVLKDVQPFKRETTEEKFASLEALLETLRSRQPTIAGYGLRLVHAAGAGATFELAPVEDDDGVVVFETALSNPFPEERPGDLKLQLRRGGSKAGRYRAGILYANGCDEDSMHYGDDEAVAMDWLTRQRPTLSHLGYENLPDKVPASLPKLGEPAF